VSAGQRIRRSCPCGATARIAAHPAVLAEELASVFDGWHAACTSLGSATSVRLAAQGDQPDPMFDVPPAEELPPVQGDLIALLELGSPYSRTEVHA
jgi:hypothetical protein